MSRLRASIVKEIWAVLRDRKARIVLVLPPLVQLMVFSFATTLEVKKVDIAVYDRSGGAHAVELVQRLHGSSYFRHIRPVQSPAEVRAAIDRREVLAALVIEQDFDRRLNAGQSASVGLILDGRRSNAAQIAAGYVRQVTGGMGVPSTMANAGGGVAITHWFNPALEYTWFTLPSLIAIITAVAGLAITSQSVSRQREDGTFDQLLVSPLRTHEILIAKMTPAFLMGLFNGTLFWVIAQVVFGVPFFGSIILFYLALVAFLLAMIGFGLFISAVSMTQQQSFMGTFLVMTPMLLLSGYASPIENMPEWLQYVTLLNPQRYFLIILHGVFLKAMPASEILMQVWPLVVIAIVMLSAAAWMFRSRME
ncbi:MAG: ABC transporter permease [Caenibius sp.]